MSISTLRAKVIAILSGDTIVVELEKESRRVVSFPYLIAPIFGHSDGTSQDEPHGFDSWHYLRNKCIDKYVFISNNQAILGKFRYVPSLEERYSLHISRIALDDHGTPVDIGTDGARDGMLSLRPSTRHVPKADQPYYDELRQLTRNAETARIGIWAEGGLVRVLPSICDPDPLLKERDLFKNSLHWAKFF
jgi:hypothetical protein